MSDPKSETNASVFPKMVPCDFLLIISIISLMTSLVPLMSGMLLDNVLLIVGGVILLLISAALFPIAIRRLNLNSIRLSDASKRIVYNLELEYGIRISPTENVFDYETKVKLTSRDILGTDANGEGILVSLRTDDTGSRVVPFVIRNAAKVS